MNKRTHILVVDDEISIIKYLKGTLEARGYQVSAAVNGEEAVQKAGRELPDLIVMDIMMPILDGLKACIKLREWLTVPIIMLSARNSEEDKITCLNAGADDYLVKPFSVDELEARVNAVLRRVQKVDDTVSQPVFESGNLRISFIERRVTVDGRDIKLTPTEYNLLRELVLNANKVLTYEMLLRAVWGLEYGQEKEYVRVFIRRLRKVIEEDPDNPRHIVTLSHIGYKFQI